jgi:hypothetical protein
VPDNVQFSYFVQFIYTVKLHSLMWGPWCTCSLNRLMSLYNKIKKVRTEAHYGPCDFKGLASYLVEGHSKSRAVAKCEMVGQWDYKLLSWQQNLWCWHVSNRCLTTFRTPVGDMTNQEIIKGTKFAFIYTHIHMLKYSWQLQRNGRFKIQ